MSLKLKLSCYIKLY